MSGGLAGAGAPAVAPGDVQPRLRTPITWRGLSPAAKTMVVVTGVIALVGIVVGILSGTNQLERTGRFFSKDIPNFFTQKIGVAEVWWAAAALAVAVTLFVATALGVRKYSQRVERKNNEDAITDLKDRLGKMTAAVRAAENAPRPEKPVDVEKMSDKIRTMLAQSDAIKAELRSIKESLGQIEHHDRQLAEERIKAEEIVTRLMAERSEILARIDANRELETEQAGSEKDLKQKEADHDAALQANSLETEDATYNDEGELKVALQGIRDQLSGLQGHLVQTRRIKQNLANARGHKDEELRIAESRVKEVSRALRTNSQTRQAKATRTNELMNNLGELKLLASACNDLLNHVTIDQAMQLMLVRYNGMLTRLTELGWTQDADRVAEDEIECAKKKQHAEQAKGAVATMKQRVKDGEEQVQLMEKNIQQQSQAGGALGLAPQILQGMKNQLQQNQNQLEMMEPKAAELYKEWQMAADALAEKKALIALKNKWDNKVIGIGDDAAEADLPDVLGVRVLDAG